MSAKDNFAQAMKELLNSGEGEGPISADEGRAPGSFSSFSTPDARPPKAPAPERHESVFGSGSLSASIVEEPAEEETAVAVETIEEETAAPAVEEVAAEEAAPQVSAPAYTSPAAPQDTTPATPSTDAVTVIAPGTTIVGNISTLGSLTMNGDVKGDVKVAKKLILEGRIIGDVDAQEVEVIRSSIKGNVTVASEFSMDDHTVVVGDISAKNACTNGKIKGNLTVLERGHLKPSATLVGNLVAGTVIIDEGAMLKGDIAITNAQNENIVVDEPEFDIEI